MREHSTKPFQICQEIFPRLRELESPSRDKAEVSVEIKPQRDRFPVRERRVDRVGEPRGVVPLWDGDINQPIWRIAAECHKQMMVVPGSEFRQCLLEI